MPTLVYPNRLDIDIVKEVYDDTNFVFTVLVTDQWGNPVPGAIISGTWDETAITAGATDGSGRYTFTVAAKLVASGSPGKTLAITASHIGYYDGQSSTEIAVDPAAVEKSTGGHDVAGIPGTSIWLISIVSAVAIVYLAKMLNKKKKYIER